MELKREADTNDLYKFVKEDPRRYITIIKYMTAEIADKGISPRSRYLANKWIGQLVAANKIEKRLRGKKGTIRFGVYCAVIPHEKKPSSDTKKKTARPMETEHRYEIEQVDKNYELGLPTKKKIPTISGRKIKFRITNGWVPTENDSLLAEITQKLDSGFEVEVLVLEYPTIEAVYYKYAALFFKSGVLKRVHLNRSINQFNRDDPFYAGTGKRAHDAIEGFLKKNPEIKVARDNRRLRTDEDFFGSQKDEEAVIDHLEKSGYLRIDPALAEKYGLYIL